LMFVTAASLALAVPVVGGAAHAADLPPRPYTKRGIDW